MKNTKQFLDNPVPIGTNQGRIKYMELKMKNMGLGKHIFLLTVTRCLMLDLVKGKSEGLDEPSLILSPSKMIIEPSSSSFSILIPPFCSHKCKVIHEKIKTILKEGEISASGLISKKLKLRQFVVNNRRKMNAFCFSQLWEIILETDRRNYKGGTEIIVGSSTVETLSINVTMLPVGISKIYINIRREAILDIFNVYLETNNNGFLHVTFDSLKKELHFFPMG